MTKFDAAIPRMQTNDARNGQAEAGETSQNTFDTSKSAAIRNNPHVIAL